MAEITDIVGKIPYRIALAGGWIDQPFVSKNNPNPPGAMVVVSIIPEFRFMDRSGICGSTRRIALEMWKNKIPDGDPEEFVRELYYAENKGVAEPSGTQDMIGLVYPGISRIDYDYNCHGGYFPKHIESNTDSEIAKWLEEVIHILPVAPRPDGYNPLEQKNLDPKWIGRLGNSGKDCYDAILNKDLPGLGASFNECMKCWEIILPQTVKHPALTIDLLQLLNYYQSKFPGAMYSGCGGGYLYVASKEPIPGSFNIKVRTK